MLVTGDLNADGSVNFSDLLILAQHYGQPGTLADGDVNGDGTVNFADLLLLAQNYGRSMAGATGVAAAGTSTFFGDPGSLERLRHRAARRL